MTMKLIQTNLKESDIIKPMNKMEDGEVCYCLETEEYIFKVCHTGQQNIFLILDSDKTSDSYGEGVKHQVRELRIYETVTIQFSK